MQLGTPAPVGPVMLAPVAISSPQPRVPFVGLLRAAVSAVRSGLRFGAENQVVASGVQVCELASAASRLRTVAVLATSSRTGSVRQFIVTKHFTHSFY